MPGLPADDLWRNREFVRFWTGETISLVGSQVTAFALPITAVLVLGASPAQMGLLGALSYLPFLVLTLPAGAAWTARGRATLIGFREALREVVAAHGSAPPPKALEVIATAARTAVLTVEFDATGAANLRPTGHGLDALIAQLLGDVASAQRTGTWLNLRVCRRDVCRWAFYDASRNHSGVWCTMSICGNRVKSANLRRRRSGKDRGAATAAN